MSNTTIIEINGVKLEVDLRTAKRIDTLRVGDRVKCLVKGYSDHTVHAGVVVGFEPFEKLPGIIVAYLETGYGTAGLKFKTFNAETKDFEVVADIDNNSLEVDKKNILDIMDREIDKKSMELDELKKRRAFFLEKFQTYFDLIGEKL